MTLPQPLKGIFKKKQRSYKMVLILCMTEEESIEANSIDIISERFRKHFIERENKKIPVDSPPHYLGDSWASLSSGQLRTIIQNPIQALSRIVDLNHEENSLSFKPQISNLLNAEVIAELRNYSHHELEAYYTTHYNSEKQHLIKRESTNKEYPTFKITMAYLHYIQGVMFYFSMNLKKELSLRELLNPSNRTTIFKSGDKIKNPEERLRTFCRVLKEFGFIEISADQISLTPRGEAYCTTFQENHWEFHPNQVKDIRGIIQDEINENEILQVIRLALQLSSELNRFSALEFQQSFVQAMNTTNWEEVTQESRSRFMLNWLLELSYIEKTSEGTYLYLGQEEIEKMESEDHLTVSERIHKIKSRIQKLGFSYPNLLIENFYLSLKSKPFVILAGISGTGKTKLIQKFADALGATEENGQFTLIPVRPDWNDPSDLIGYMDLRGTFRRGKLTYILEAASKPENQRKPYFICLDEMNLARVEHYFSDFLSILETQRWSEGRIVTDTVVAEEQVGKNIGIPDNVFFIGTVNMDETTHPFSKKVLDRVNTIEFNQIQLDHFTGLKEASREIEEEAEATVYPTSDFLKSDYLQLKDAYRDYEELIQHTVSQLVQINSILESIHAHVGFRVRDAICFYMIYNERFSLMTFHEAIDMQILQKILPRIQGNNSAVRRVIIDLLLFCLDGALSNNRDYVNGEKDIEQIWSKRSNENSVKYPESARKLIYMLRRLDDDGFTSFWVS